MSKKVIISVTNDLFSDNRVHKVAQTLHNNGFEILLVGRLLKNSPEIKREYKTKRFRLLFNKSAFFYFEYNLRLFLFLIFAKADVFLSNDLDTLLANFLASKIKTKKLVYDSHELFTEVPELIKRPKIKKVWEKIEKFCLPKVKTSYTVCDSIAEYYFNKYSVKMNVIKNLPFYYEFESPFIKEQNSKKILLYQGAVNIQRGLEEIVDAMKFMKNFELHIIGSGDIMEDLKNEVKDANLGDKVKFFGRISVEELKKFTLKADLGLSLEKNAGLNYYYSLPNKIFDYIQAEVPVLCSDLPEMKNVIKKYNIGEVLLSHNPEELAKQIENIFKDNEKLSLWHKNLVNAKKELCWENQVKLLLSIFK